MRHAVIGIGIAALFMAAIAQAETATTIKATELKKAPANDAEVVANIGENTQVDVVKRQGAWMLVKEPAGQEGWLRMLLLRMGDPNAAPAKTGGGDFLGGLGKALNVARTGSSGSAVATGVRGLTPEELANAQPNPAQIAIMKKYSADPARARAFAAAGGLQAQQVEYLPAPAGAPSGGNNDGVGNDPAKWGEN